LTSSFFQTKEKKTHIEKKNHREEEKCIERRELIFKLPLYLFTFNSCFYPLAFALSFQVLSPSIFFFSSKRKKTQKKNHREEKICKEGRELTFKLPLWLSLLAPTFALLLLHFHFKHFLLASSSSQVEKKTKNTKKKKL
jgi:hypothetical protein